ncbi:MAG: histone deacetylase [Phycisphaerae bacterium]|nr:histone deacetylase [Phycisphaerae bacterium]
MISAYYHPGYAVDIGAHIMPMRKFSMVAQELSKLPWVKLLTPEPVTEADLLRVHTPGYIQAIKTGQPRDLAESQKFPWSKELWQSVLLTSGGCLAAAKQALLDGSAAALVSGFHHSHAERGEGFCTFNGLIVTAEALRAEGRITRISILDMDLHYGNGTALLARTRPWVTAVSIYGNDYWQNVAYRDVSTPRHEDGENHRSFPLPAGCDRSTLLQIMDQALPELLRRGRPDLLLYQAGADPLKFDPYSPLNLDHADLLARDRRVFEFAREHDLPIAWVLAGGYTHDTSQVVKVHVNTFEAWKLVFGRP